MRLAAYPQASWFLFLGRSICRSRPCHNVPPIIATGNSGNSPHLLLPWHASTLRTLSQSPKNLLNRWPLQDLNEFIQLIILPLATILIKRDVSSWFIFFLHLVPCLRINTGSTNINLSIDTKPDDEPFILMAMIIVFNMFKIQFSPPMPFGVFKFSKFPVERLLHLLPPSFYSIIHVPL